MVQRFYKSRFITCLVIYYGVIQAAHFISLIRAAIIYLKNNVLTFPASPPESGWTDQAEFFLIGMGIFDIFNIFGTFILLYGFFAQKKWVYWFALINLTAMISLHCFLYLVLSLPVPGSIIHLNTFQLPYFLCL